MTNTPHTFATYARVAREAQNSGSIERQMESSERYAAEQGWVLEGRYSDVDSATSMERPGLNAALDAIRSGRAQHLVTASLDRLARRPADLERVLEAVTDVDGTLVAGDTIIAGPDDKLWARMMVAISAAEPADLGTRIRAGMKARRP